MRYILQYKEERIEITGDKRPVLVYVDRKTEPAVELDLIPEDLLSELIEESSITKVITESFCQVSLVITPRELKHELNMH